MSSSPLSPSLSSLPPPCSAAGLHLCSGRPRPHPCCYHLPPPTTTAAALGTSRHPPPRCTAGAKSGSRRAESGAAALITVLPSRERARRTHFHSQELLGVAPHDPATAALPVEPPESCARTACRTRLPPPDFHAWLAARGVRLPPPAAPTARTPRLAPAGCVSCLPTAAPAWLPQIGMGWPAPRLTMVNGGGRKDGVERLG
ncbi:hypothetical protein PVAP13_3KG515600 [Panicum virgatum]|uniref:Uncharacterized protein n=1 Tax=Panicum virgatum TaxID=38727 RepID=A0A8T0V9L7_PANVG|nr:hypothetical protein PVAP13_3KG515600 [Panicum virgatum]